MNNWKDQVREAIYINHFSIEQANDSNEKVIKVIETLLEEQRKEFEYQLDIQNICLKTDLINQILSEAPEDKEMSQLYSYNLGKEGFNEANQLWREIISKIGKTD